MSQQFRQSSISRSRLGIVIATKVCAIDKDIGYRTLSRKLLEGFLYFGTILNFVHFNNLDIIDLVLTQEILGGCAIGAVGFGKDNRLVNLQREFGEAV